MDYLLDTNTVIALLKGDGATLLHRLRAQNPQDIGISSIVVHELYFGAFKSARVEANLDRLAAMRFEVVAFDLEDAIVAGQVRAALQARGTPIGPFDVLIAGQALCRNLAVVTANVREFSRVEGLRVEDWTLSS